MAIDETFEYEALTARFYSRESSTLTIATFMAAASLTVLAIGVQIADPRIWLMGLAFSFAGIVYRELTVFTMDRKDLRRIREIERNRGFRQLTKWDKFFKALRWFMFRCAIITPFAGLVRFWAIVDRWLPMWWMFYPLWLLYPLGSALAEYYCVDKDRPRN
jgi:hypothetical protein